MLNLEYPILESLDNPDRLKRFSDAERSRLAEEIRNRMTEVCSRLGGHIGAGLGVVELTIALHTVFDTPHDRIVWDVSHQIYPHKLLTGRNDRFDTLRQLNGMSGFAKRTESNYDSFGAGHASTSISAATGMEHSTRISGNERRIVAVIGDGGLTGGMALEALYDAGRRRRKMIIVLNDNEMSIGPNVGALSAFLSKKLAGQPMRRFKREMRSFLESFASHGQGIISWMKKAEDSFKAFFTPGLLFEAMGLNYVGPVNGHDIGEMIDCFERIADSDGPVIVHVLTTKGKGYEPAEADQAQFHGLGPFERETGEVRKKSGMSYSQAFCETLMRLAEADSRVVAITAAMPDGTGLGPFLKKYPDRFFDVGIAEQHATDFVAGLAQGDLLPVFAVYSTFLQRAIAPIIHTVAPMKKPMIFAIDRAGIVGDDGETHQGVFDLAFLRGLPNLILCAPKNHEELAWMLASATQWSAPTAIRYPRGQVPDPETPELRYDLIPGEAEVEREGEGVAILAIGSRVLPAVEAADRYAKETGKRATVINMRFLQPLDEKTLASLIESHNVWITIEEASVVGGLGSAISGWLAHRTSEARPTLRRIGVGDHFVKQGPQAHWYAEFGLDAEGIYRAIDEAYNDDAGG